MRRETTFMRCNVLGLARTAAIFLAFVMVLVARRAQAQSLPMTEAELLKEFRGSAALRPVNHGRLDDGTEARSYKGADGTLLAIAGPTDAPFEAEIIVPLKDSDVVVASTTAFVMRVCAKGDVTGPGATFACDPAAVTNWLTTVTGSADRKRGTESKRFGQIEFTYLFVADVAIPGLGLKADSRPAFLEAGVARVAAEHAREANEREAQRVAALRAELEAVVGALPAGASSAQIIAVQQRVASADLDAQTLRKLSATLSSKAVAAYVREGDAALGAGDLRAAAATTEVAEKEAANADDRAAAEKARGLKTRLLVKQGAAAETKEQWKISREFYDSAVTLGAGEDAKEGIERVDSHKKSTVLAVLASVIPGGGQFYSGRYAEAALFFGGTTVLAVGGGAMFAGAGAEYASYRRATNSADTQSHYQAVQGLWVSSIIAFGLAGGIWVWNLFDAPGRAKGWNSEHIGVE